ncbi:MAG: hypothetical protein KJ559_03290 [Nanoarchaeota archaeon]|nr:hypothetical protein [Nanoarchaeota archaeon]
MTQGYYVERMDGKCNFNLWEKDGRRYFNVATLFYQDAMCGTQWTTDDKAKAVNYGADEIQDELENPLRQIPTEKAQHLLKLTSEKEVADSLEGLLE